MRGVSISQSINLGSMFLISPSQHSSVAKAMAAKPLEVLKSPYYNSIKGDLEDISVLDRRHCQDVLFPDYQPPPKVQPETDPLIWQNWVENLTCLNENLSWLLKLQYQKFWCQVINNASIHSFLDSYLKFAPRFLESNWPDDVAFMHDELHRLVFVTYIRLAANKESTTNYMTAEYFGELIYDKYIFDIPKLMDICTLYGNETNSQLLSKAIKNVFKCQPRYNDDLKTSIATILQTFQSISDKCSSPTDHSTYTISKLSEDKMKNMNLTEFEDIIIYTSDICYTLQRFLVDVFSSACQYFLESVEYLADFYSTTLDNLRNNMHQRHFDDLSLRSNMLSHLKISRFAILSIVKKIMNECLLERTLQASRSGDRNQAEKYANEYLNLLSEFMDRPSFYCDFLRRMSITEDVKSLIQHCPFLDDARVSFIMQSLGVKGNSWNKPEEFARVSEEISERQQHQETSVQVRDVLNKKKPVTDPELASLISTVCDVLPHFDEDYVRSYLLHFERDSEKTIHALLEGTVPDFEKSQDTVEEPPREPASVEIESVTKSMSLLNSRRNVFDNDEFDIFNHENVDMSRIHKGKKSKDEPDGKSIDDFKHIYKKYSMVSDEEEIPADERDAVGTYDDEYDDAYDGLGIDANDADDNYDILKRRPFVTPRVFQQGKKAVRDESSDLSEDDRDSASTRDHFIANPAEIRAKNEARRQQQQQLRHPRRTNAEQARQPNKTGSTATAHQRKRKDVSKAKVGNHNRKQMATKKASKGMGPV